MEEEELVDWRLRWMRVDDEEEQGDMYGRVRGSGGRVVIVCIMSLV